MFYFNKGSLKIYYIIFYIFFKQIKTSGQSHPINNDPPLIKKKAAKVNINGTKKSKVKAI